MFYVRQNMPRIFSKNRNGYLNSTTLIVMVTATMSMSIIKLSSNWVCICYSTGLKRGPKPKTDKQKLNKDSGSSGTDSSEDESTDVKPLKRKSKRKRKNSKAPTFLIQTSSGRTPKATMRYAFIYGCSLALAIRRSLTWKFLQLLTFLDMWRRI